MCDLLVRPVRHDYELYRLCLNHPHMQALKMNQRSQDRCPAQRTGELVLPSCESPQLQTVQQLSMLGCLLLADAYGL